MYPLREEYSIQYSCEYFQVELQIRRRGNSNNSEDQTWPHFGLSLQLSRMA